MHAGNPSASDCQRSWIDRIEEQMRLQDAALGEALRGVRELGPVTLGVPGAALEEIHEACEVRRPGAAAPVCATRC